MPEYASSSKGYGALWDKAVIDPAKAGALKHLAERIKAQYPRYANTEAKTGVPKQWIGPTEQRESSLDARRNIAQGDPWNRKSTHVPRGMGPFTSWDEAAIAAFKLPAHRLDKVQRWSVERYCYEWEKWNGYGYLRHGVNSPYVYAWTNLQQSGKYVSDGVWSATAWDVQPGCVAMLKTLAEIDPELKERLKDREATPPKEVKDHEIKPGKRVTQGGGAGTVGTIVQKPVTDGPKKTVVHYALEYTALAVFGIIVVVGVVMIVRKAKLLKDKWG